MPAGSNNRIGTWTAIGTGTVTVNATTKSVTITPANDGTITIARQQITTEIGKRYWVTYEHQATLQIWRNIGTTAGGTDIVNVNVSSGVENKFNFVATTTSVWMDFARTSAGTTTVGNIRFEEAPAANPPARRLNGRTQFFKLDAAAAGLRTSNSLQYLGGWVKFQYMPTAGVYLLDFAIPDAVASGGGQRVRIVYDPVTPKIFASSGGSTAAGSKYIENYRTPTGLTVDTWHYVGVALAANGAVTLVYDNNIGGTTTGTGVPEVANYLTVLHLGSRNGATPSSFAPVIYSDWVWCAGFVPTNDQITAIANGNRPNNIAGFAPTFYWPLEGTALDEPSSAGVAVLSANTQPGQVVGPAYIIPPTAEIFPLMMF
jgi:hypothetical protein